ncbi:Uncharacterised protein [Acinetobacter baumannii]|nr:Uncharacterised protein [Acinetobacter baumannii]
MRPLALAMTISTVEVNRSAPDTTTSINPREKQMPPTSFASPKGTPAVPVVAVM